MSLNATSTRLLNILRNEDSTTFSGVFSFDSLQTEIVATIELAHLFKWIAVLKINYKKSDVII